MHSSIHLMDHARVSGLQRPNYLAAVVDQILPMDDHPFDGTAGVMVWTPRSVQRHVGPTSWTNLMDQPHGPPGATCSVLTCLARGLAADVVGLTSRTTVTSDLQSGQTACFVSHSSIHCWWNVWPQRSVRTVSALQYSDKQTQQLSNGSIGTHTPEFSASPGAVRTTEDPSDCSAAAVSPEILGTVAGPGAPLLSVVP